MRAVLTRSKSNDIGLVGRAIHGITLPLVAVHIKGKNTTNANRWIPIREKQWQIHGNLRA